MNNDFPALDCPAVVNDLAHRLGSLPHFLDAINDVMKFGRLEDHELQHYSRKIIALTENARITLRREGVALYIFVLCSEELLPYKSAYFKLLLWIRRRRPAFPADMGDRITSLLFVLESNFVIRCGGVDTRAQLGIEELLVPKNPLAARERTIQTAVNAAAGSPTRGSFVASDVMLAPDALAKRQQRIHQLKKYVKSEAANTRPKVSRQYLPSDNFWAPPVLRRPFVRTKAHSFEADPERKKSSLEDLLKIRDFDLD
ncbi:uncharacterized protein EDB93DRAFT_1109000 [Suillus bovinus]|uniref:uncharacterized protein n=1 Tax=Suillus bovinus TaxID=48563 RepID=UPI001B8817FA|nr:uncharacterized protein EDB93DRAFT_1109000 [Suillus bovinus]KAG2128373.1 hypothetical protein EDB93DRAFT_1109000 [Suillus bovinus]